MKAITPQSLANSAAVRWKEQYCGPRHWIKLAGGKSAKRIYEKLIELGDNPIPEEVCEVIGNRGWVKPQPCSECGADAQKIVEVGEEPDYESATAYLCQSCVKSALGMFQRSDCNKCEGWGCWDCCSSIEEIQARQGIFR